MNEVFLPVMAIAAFLMLIWDCVEVGRNDAANLVNAVFGSRVMGRKLAVAIAGVAVVLGASFASPVMETARKGIFDPGMLTLQAAVVVYVTAYIVDTALLHTYSAFGMPVSTTASLVFELVGASIAVAASLSIVDWDKVGTVISAIVISIVLSGIAGFLVQRMFRAAVDDDPEDHMKVLLHGPWVAGIMFTWLTWFMVMKGLKAVPAIKELRAATVDAHGPMIYLIIVWGLFTLITHLILVMTKERGTSALFKLTAIVGMLCLSFAFGQNDLANCASPGLSAIWLWRHVDVATEIASKIAIPWWALFGCGLLMVAGMTSKNAQRVTRAAVNTGSQYDRVALYAPKWCRAIARTFIRETPEEHVDLAPPPARDDHGKRIHFDPLRASVIMAVSASVIAFASSKGLPVSTTYVTFAAVIATGLADRTMTRGDGDRKIGRAIWVIFSWFAGALLAVVASAAVAWVLLKLSLIGLALMLALNIGIRFFVGKRSEAHEHRYHEEISEQQRVEEGIEEPPADGDSGQ